MSHRSYQDATPPPLPTVQDDDPASARSEDFGKGTLMTSMLTEQLGVASNARHWDVTGFRLYESTVPDVLLYVATQLRLARDGAGHRRAALTQVQRWSTGASYEVLSGSAVLGFSPDAFTDTATAIGLQDSWARVVLNTGYVSRTPGGRPRFVPLAVRDVHLTSTVDAGQATPSGDGIDAASRTVVLDLTAAGARDWAACVRGDGTVDGSVKATYTYPAMMPPATTTVRTHGRRIYEVLAGALRHAADGTLFGDLAAVRSAWTALVRTGAVEVVLSGAPPADLAGARDDLVDQVREQLFDSLFAPYPSNDISGPLYALRFTRPEDVPDLPVTITVEGWTWMSASLDAQVSDLLREMDSSYLLTSYETVSVPVSLVVEPAPQIRTVAVSLDFGAAHVPEAPTFDGAGGTKQYLIATEHPDQVSVAYRAKLDFAPAGWAVLEVTGTASATPDGYRIVLSPEELIHRHTLYVYVRQGQRLLRATETDPSDFLTVTVTRAGVETAASARASTRVTPQAPVEISYPLAPGTGPQPVTLSAVGIVGGRLVRGVDLQVADDEEALYLLVDDSGVQLVGRSAVLPESDPLAGRLRSAAARPVVTTGAPPSAEDDQSIDVQVDVELVPQPTDVTCWAASLAMVVGARDKQSVPPATIAAAAGMDVDTGYGWPDIQRAVEAWNLTEEGPRSAVPSEWARLLQDWGPIWIVEVGAPYHAVVIAGVSGDGTAESTYVLIYNPWPPGTGVIEWKTFADFDTEFGLGAGAGAAMVHAGS